VLVILGVGYIVLTLPGSIVGSTANTLSATSISISANPNPIFSSGYIRVYIPAGASIGASVANFDPQNIKVVIGVNNTVIWMDLDPQVHCILGANGLFKSGNLTAGQTWIYVFSTPGIYKYYDAYYGWLNGTVNVVS
jgi:plastocyanin